MPTGERYPLLDLTPQRQKQRRWRRWSISSRGLRPAQPVLLAYEDVHWIDPTTQELVGLAIEHIQRLPVLLLITFRPEFSPPWSGQPHVSALALTRLGRREGAALVERVVRREGAAGRGRRADRGQDRRRAAVRRGADQDGAGIRACSRTRATTTSWPARCRRSPSPRLCTIRCSPASTASLRSRRSPRSAPRSAASFPTSCSPRSPTGRRRSCRRRSTSWSRPSWSTAAAPPPEATYSFKHALVQDAAYGTLLKIAPPAAPRPHRQGAGGALSGNRRNPARAARPSLHAGGVGRSGCQILAQGSAVGACALRSSGSD